MASRSWAASTNAARRTGLSIREAVAPTTSRPGAGSTRRRSGSCGCVRATSSGGCPSPLASVGCGLRRPQTTWSRSTGPTGARRSAIWSGGSGSTWGPFFGGRRMATITTADVRRFVDQRQAAGAANGEINRELASLKRMYSLALHAGKLMARPHIPLLEENNVRTGFFDRAQIEAVLAHLPAPVQPVIRFAYLTGWRVPSEVLTLEWRQGGLPGGDGAARRSARRRTRAGGCSRSTCSRRSGTSCRRSGG